ncbi:MAG TPA: EF-hand domain-containing protein, partial [Smithellaceae bacterium]|nr:EF-hand domain-containing protein [Smithellaceae bacterium]
MKKIISLSFALLFVFTVAVGFSSAQTKNPVVSQTVFVKMDAGKDGVITVAEHSAYWQGRFKEVDADKDGKIIAAEFEAAVKDSFGAQDADNDSILVAQEYIACWCGPNAKIPQKAKATKKLDANNDGKISDDECAVFWMARFKDVDENKDQKITRDEFLKAMRKIFKEIDKDGNGII